MKMEKSENKWKKVLDAFSLDNYSFSHDHTMNTKVNNSFQFDPVPLQRARALKRIDVQQLARRADTSIATVSRVLNGHTKNSRALVDICDVLGVDLAECYPTNPANPVDQETAA